LVQQPSASASAKMTAQAAGRLSLRAGLPNIFLANLRLTGACRTPKAQKWQCAGPDGQAHRLTL